MEDALPELVMFTLQQANKTLPAVIEATEETIARLQEIEVRWSGLPFRPFDALGGLAEEDRLRVEWMRRAAALGVAPKGFFVVDFQSPDRDTVYCWTHGEEAVAHEHKIWEGFADRRPIRDVC